MSGSGRCVAITGAAGGIGRALCKRFSEAGDSLALIDRRIEVREVAEEFRRSGVDADASVLDISDADAVADAFKGIQEKIRRLRRSGEQCRVFVRADPCEFDARRLG